MREWVIKFAEWLVNRYDLHVALNTDKQWSDLHARWMNVSRMYEDKRMLLNTTSDALDRSTRARRDLAAQIDDAKAEITRLSGLNAVLETAALEANKDFVREIDKVQEKVELLIAERDGFALQTQARQRALDASVEVLREKNTVIKDLLAQVEALKSDNQTLGAAVSGVSDTNKRTVDELTSMYETQIVSLKQQLDNVKGRFNAPKPVMDILPFVKRLVDKQDVTSARGTSGEFKRDRVYEQVLNTQPHLSPKHIMLAILLARGAAGDIGNV